MAMTDIDTGTSAPRGSLLLLRPESNCDMCRVKARKRIGTSQIDQTVLKLRTCERGIRYCTQIILGHVSLKFVQMVAPPTPSAK